LLLFFEPQQTANNKKKQLPIATAKPQGKAILNSEKSDFLPRPFFSLGTIT